MTARCVVIVGDGHAGFQCAASLRQQGFEGRIILVGRERGLPYQRPPLSKAYLLGKTSAEQLCFRPERFFSDQRIERVTGEVQSIDRAAGSVRARDGRVFGYDHLVLAVGGQHRRLQVPGADLGGVFGLQTLDQAEALRARLQACRHAVVVGAGFIGLEFAAVARSVGIDVQVLELADRPMARALSRSTGEFFRHAHAGNGIGMHFGVGVSQIVGDDGVVSAVVTSDGQRLPADLVLAGIGAVPNVELAFQAGLEVDNGILVDETLLTSDPRISAIGDVASFPCPQASGRVRLESVQNAGDQARAAAARICGKPAPYAVVPWFWSDQGALKLQIAGLRHAHDSAVVIGDRAAGSFSVLCFNRAGLTAVESVNRPADHMLARRLLAGPVDLTPADAALPGFDLKSWALAAAEA